MLKALQTLILNPLKLLNQIIFTSVKKKKLEEGNEQEEGQSESVWTRPTEPHRQGPL